MTKIELKTWEKIGLGAMGGTISIAIGLGIIQIVQESKLTNLEHALIHGLRTDDALHNHGNRMIYTADPKESVPSSYSPREMYLHVREFPNTEYTILQKSFDPALSDLVNGRHDTEQLYYPIATSRVPPFVVNRHEISSKSKIYAETPVEFPVFYDFVQAKRYAISVQTALGGRENINLEVVPITTELLNTHIKSSDYVHGPAK